MTGRPPPLPAAGVAGRAAAAGAGAAPRLSSPAARGGGVSRKGNPPPPTCRGGCWLATAGRPYEHPTHYDTSMHVWERGRPTGLIPSPSPRGGSMLPAARPRLLGTTGAGRVSDPPADCITVPRARGTGASGGGASDAPRPVWRGRRGPGATPVAVRNQGPDRRGEPAHHRVGLVAVAGLPPWPSPSGRQDPLGRGPSQAGPGRPRPRGGYDGGSHSVFWRGPRVAATGVSQCKDTSLVRDSTIVQGNSSKQTDSTVVERKCESRQ